MKKFGYVLTSSDATTSRTVGNMLDLAGTFCSRVSLSDDEKTVSLVDALKKRALDLSCGNKVTVTVEGRDEEAAVAALQDYFVNCM